MCVFANLQARKLALKLLRRTPYAVGAGCFGPALLRQKKIPPSAPVLELAVTTNYYAQTEMVLFCRSAFV